MSSTLPGSLLFSVNRGNSIYHLVLCLKNRQQENVNKVFLTVVPGTEQVPNTSLLGATAFRKVPREQIGTKLVSPHGVAGLGGDLRYSEIHSFSRPSETQNSKQPQDLPTAMSGR
jgi:hypothetical protein